MGDLNRIDNHPGTNLCADCQNSGMVAVSKRQQFETTPDTVEEFGPCPKCKRGYRLEFGLYQDKEGNELEHLILPWGPQGYWRGKMVTFWPELPRVPDSELVPIPANLLRQLLPLKTFDQAAAA